MKANTAEMIHKTGDAALYTTKIAAINCARRPVVLTTIALKLVNIKVHTEKNQQFDGMTIDSRDPTNTRFRDKRCFTAGMQNYHILDIV